jgi:transglutaminase-like putative cysteine protease
MIAMCRVLGIRARYVSGHMLGEGSTHAWVEVLIEDAEDPSLLTAIPFDPCHLRIPDLSYITIAVGRDYGDVPPTSGTYSGSAANHLASYTVLGVTLLR